MRSILSASLAVAVLLQPLSAFALIDTPTALLQALQSDRSARSIKGEAHAHSEDMTYISVWFSGSQQGGPDAQSVVADMKVTLDFVDLNENVKLRAKGAMIMKDAMAYIRVENIEGTYEDSAMKMLFSLALKQWIKVPLEENAYVQEDVIGAEGLSEQFLDMVSATYPGGTRYELTLNQETMDMIGMLVGSTPTKDAMRINIHLDTKDVVQSGTFTMNMAIPEFSIRADAKMQKLAGAVNVTIPEHTLTAEEFAAQLPDFAANLVPVMQFAEYPEPFDSEYSEEWDVPYEYEEEEPVNPRANVERKSRRVLRQEKLEEMRMRGQ